jgi:hypothetical protein
MSRKDTPAAAIPPAKPKPDLLFLLVQVVLSVYLVIRVTGSGYYAEHHAPLQLPVYLVLFNCALMLFRHYAARPFGAGSVRLFWWLLGLSGFLVYVFSFYPVLDLSGDNAAYLSRAQSVIEGKGFRNLWLANEPFESTLKGVGFSLLNIPMILVFGLNNYIGLKLLDLAATFGGIFFLYRFFENKMDRGYAFLLAALVGLHSQIVHFSTIIMTESMSFFLLFFSLYLTDRFVAETERTTWKTVLASAGLGLLVFFSFTVREALIGLVAVLPLFLVLRKRWLEAAAGVAVIGACFLGYAALSSHLKHLNETYGLVAAGQSGGIQSSSFVRYYLDLLLTTVKTMNLKPFWDAVLVITQKVVGDPDLPQERYKVILNLLVLAVCLAGAARRIAQKARISSYDLFFFVLLFVVVFSWGSQTDYGVFSRYFYPLIPFVFFYFILGVQFAAEKVRFAKPAHLTAAVLGLSFVFMFGMNTSAVYASKYPYSPQVLNFISACGWIKQNTPKETVIADRKSTLGFIWSGRKSMHFYNDSVYSRYSFGDPAFSFQQFQTNTLNYYRSNRIEYVIIDTFSEAYGVILPVVRNNPGLFTLATQFGRPQATLVLRFDRR